MNLERLLQYACEYNYISKSNYKKNVSYQVDGKNVAGECDICTKILVPFLPEIIGIVSQLKDLPTGVIENSSDVNTNYHDKIKHLTKELQDKELLISWITKL